MGFRITSTKEIKRDICMKVYEKIEKIFYESSQLIRESAKLSKDITKAISEMKNCLEKGNKIIIFGNGGSAADAQHIAGELIGRFQMERNSLPVIALNTDTSILTALGNDYSFEIIFSRQCESLVKKGDLVIGISTSGNSKNVINGLNTSKQNGAVTLALLGNDGGKIKNIVDISIIVNSNSTPRIQEVHRIIYHIICEQIEKELFEK
jgi:D-sedoheptulose 7-phosphate isomerase